MVWRVSCRLCSLPAQLSRLDKTGRAGGRGCQQRLALLRLPKDNCMPYLHPPPFFTVSDSLGIPQAEQRLRWGARWRP